MNNIVIYPFAFLYLLFCNGCKEGEVLVSLKKDPAPEIIQAKIEVERSLTIDPVYNLGNTVLLNPFTIKNLSDSAVKINSLAIEVRKLPDFILIARKELPDQNISLKPHQSFVVPETSVWDIPHSAAESSYSMYIKGVSASLSDTYLLSDTVFKSYLTFFSVMEDERSAKFSITKQVVNELPVFTLGRGLSAEYTIQKAAAALDAGISHSWFTKSYGSGPDVAVSTPNFLQRSVEETVEFYNSHFGADTKFETVIISTGIPSAAYLARTMKAPVLPLHFLISVNTIKEIQTVLDHANNNALPSYATIGHDFSLTTTKAVAWIKLLDLPKAYSNFLKQHQVQNVIILGYTGTGAGETQARKIADTKEKYGVGTMYTMRFAGNLSEQYLKQILSDYEDYTYAGFEQIADWESGIIPKQLTNFSQSIQTATGIQTTYLTSESDIELWNLATYLMLKFYKKNQSALTPGPYVQGVSLNPYLIAHPVYESWIRYVPFLYWQGFHARYHIDTRLNTVIRKAIALYFPEADFEDLTFWVNSSNNFGGTAQGQSMMNELQLEGYTVRINDFSEDEVWDPDNGFGSPVELRAKEIMGGTMDNWNGKLIPLSVQDLKEIAIDFPLLNVNQP